MYSKYHLLYLLVPFTLLEIAKGEEIVDLWYNSRMEGFRLHTTVLLIKVVYEKIGCVIECSNEPCCRSINYKKTSTFQNEPNCEILHNVFYNTSENALEKNSSFDYVYLVNPEKEYNASCFPNDLDDNVKAPAKTFCTKLIKKGCYMDPGSFHGNGKRTFPNQLATYPNAVDWYDGWNDYLHNVTCYCASLAKHGGHRFFGVQEYRQCWAGELTPEFFVSNAKANECWGVKPNYAECIDNAETKCVGRPNYNYIYEIISD